MHPKGFVIRQKTLVASFVACFLAALTSAGLGLGGYASEPPPDQAGQQWPGSTNQPVAAQTNGAKTTRQRFAETDIVSTHTVILAFTRKDVLKYHKAMVTHHGDLLTFLKSVEGLDYEITFDLWNTAGQYCTALEHVEDFLSIDSLVENEADRQRIKPVINHAVESVLKESHLSIKGVNDYLPRLKNQAVIATAIKLRDDLRDLESLLVTGI